jgi:tetratricopeptide (TPR) repeat protein
MTLREVLAAMPERDPRRGLYLVDLSMVLQLHYENRGELDDLADSVRAAREAASYPDGGMTAKRLNILGTALRTWYERTGELDALAEAIAVSRQAVDVLPAGDPNAGTCLVNLSSALHERFLASGDVSALDEAIAAARRALDALDETRREVTAMTLCNLLHSRYSTTGNLATLDEAITFGRAALAGSASSGWMRAARLSNLARALESRHWRTGDLASLQEAVRVGREAVAVCPAGHEDRLLYQLTLSGTLRALFERTRDREFLDETFTVARSACEAVPPGNPARVNHLANLAVIRRLRYDHTTDLSELDGAIAVLLEALAEVAPAHPLRPVVHATLGDVLHTRIRHTGDFSPLAEAIDTTRAALAAVAEDHPNRTMVQRTLADLLQLRHRHLGDRAALSEAIELLRSAASRRISSTQTRMDSARSWGVAAAAAGLTDLAAEGFATAVELLPLLAARSLHRNDAEHWLSRFAGLARDAAALALEVGSPERAVELLELGRTVLMAKALDVRTDLSALRKRNPALADRFEWLSVELESDDSHDQPQDRTALADELEAVVTAVRELTGMERFLLPPVAAELNTWADKGPIAIVNISEYRSDAILLTADGLRVQPLPGLTPDTAAERVDGFLTALRTDCRSPFRQARERGERTVAETLAWLWDTVDAPVLGALAPAHGQRMWWIPTGLLAFLPLHAASGRAPGESALDRVVSSYTPSIRALAHARATAARRTPSGQTLVVGMPRTPGHSGLPGAERETNLVLERVPGARKLVGSDAVRAAVIAALEDAAWAHFACHATTDRGPSDSRLLLHDHQRRPLNVAAVSELRLPSAALAYLSACDTAVTTTDLADEVIHISSAFHLAGYPRVIGTLWTIDDDAAVAIADGVYTALTTGQPDADRAAQALHDAIAFMRQTHPDQPSLWASHIHIGT